MQPSGTVCFALILKCFGTKKNFYVVYLARNPMDNLFFLFFKIYNEDNLKIFLCLIFHSLKMVLPLVDMWKCCQCFTSTRAVLFVLSRKEQAL